MLLHPYTTFHPCCWRCASRFAKPCCESTEICKPSNKWTKLMEKKSFICISLLRLVFSLQHPEYDNAVMFCSHVGFIYEQLVKEMPNVTLCCMHNCNHHSWTWAQFDMMNHCPKARSPTVTVFEPLEPLNRCWWGICWLRSCFRTWWKLSALQNCGKTSRHHTAGSLQEHHQITDLCSWVKLSLLITCPFQMNPTSSHLSCLKYGAVSQLASHYWTSLSFWLSNSIK